MDGSAFVCVFRRMDTLVLILTMAGVLGWRGGRGGKWGCFGGQLG
jgi:hypothetical protein